MDVVQPATLCAFFFDTEITDNEGELNPLCRAHLAQPFERNATYLAPCFPAP